MYETRGIFFYIGSLLFLHVFSSNFQFLKVFGSERSNSAVKSSLRIEQRGPISEKKCPNPQSWQITTGVVISNFMLYLDDVEIGKWPLE